ncbi:nucleoside deaminase [Lichenifustis flavocetrariae]|uniref:nucleoside deaminase n=1 Tax=Lichenifustis flavocetrariae TaxID=2949735 RepID=UPI003D126F69
MADKSDSDFIGEAIRVARHAESQPGCTAVGALVVLDGKVVASACNEVELRGDPTAHAEILAIRRACEAISDVQLRGATLYSTLQPLRSKQWPENVACPGGPYPMGSSTNGGQSTLIGSPPVRSSSCGE